MERAREISPELTEFEEFLDALLGEDTETPHGRMGEVYLLDMVNDQLEPESIDRKIQNYIQGLVCGKLGFGQTAREVASFIGRKAIDITELNYQGRLWGEFDHSATLTTAYLERALVTSVKVV